MTKTRKKAPAKKAKGKKAPANKTKGKKAPAKKTRARKAPAKRAGTREAPARETKARAAPARAKQRKASAKKSAPIFVTRDDGTRFFHDQACRFSIEPFVPLIRKLLDAWVMPAATVDVALTRLLNPSENTLEVDHYWTIGRELFEWGYYAEALDCLERVLRVRPDDVEVLELKIAAHDNVGQTDEARAWKKRLKSSRSRRPTQRYLLDRFVDALVTDADAVLRRNRRALDEPVVAIKLGFQESGSIVPDELWLTLAGNRTVDLSLSVPDTRIPWHEDRLADDDLLDTFTERHGLRNDAVAWSGAKAPASLLHLELTRALPGVAQRIADLGVEIAPGCVLSAGDRARDRLGADNNRARQRARELVVEARIATDLRGLSRDAVEGLAWLCYDSDARRQWLVALGTSGLGQ